MWFSWLNTALSMWLLLEVSRFCVAPPVPIETEPRDLHLSREPLDLSYPDSAYSDSSVHAQGASSEDITFARDFLIRYGHVGKYHPDPDMAELSEFNMQTGLRHFQKMMNINTTGILDDATLEMMKRPRCGVRDTGGPIRKRKKRFVQHERQWTKRILRYKMSMYGEDMPSDAQEEELKKAFKLWSDVTDLTFMKTDGGPDIGLAFTRGDHKDGRPFDGPGGAFAHAFFPKRGTIHFDEDDKYTISDEKSGLQFVQVVAHEIGHSLGLRHSEVVDALMSPLYKGYQKELTLHEDDITGIQRIYGKPTTTTIKPTTTDPATTVRIQAPRLCSLREIDAAAYDWKRQKTLFFSGDHHWQLSDYGPDPPYPIRISVIWPGLTGPVDAALDLINNNSTIYFFKGHQYYRYEDGILVRGYPKLIGRDGFFGLPGNIDSSFIWSGNNRAYFTKGKLYYRITQPRFSRRSLEKLFVDKGYPKVLSMWKGLPRSVNSALQWTNKKTYFFSKNSDLYYRFNDAKFKVDDDYPKSTKLNWLNCPKDTNW